MEDAMVINKGAYERGIGWGYVYKSVMVDLTEKNEKGTGKICYFNNWDEEKSSEYEKSLDADGLPQVRVHCPQIARSFTEHSVLP